MVDKMIMMTVIVDVSATEMIPAEIHAAPEIVIMIPVHAMIPASSPALKADRLVDQPVDAKKSKYILTRGRKFYACAFCMGMIH